MWPSYPLLLANLEPVEGVQATALVDGVGFVGVTDPFHSFLDSGDYGLRALDEVAAVREGARAVRGQGAEFVVCLSHLGYRRLDEPGATATIDPELAELVQGEVDVIIGAHSHDLLPEGERVGSVTIVQTGCFAEFLGRIDVVDGEIRASLIEVTDEVPPHPRVLAAVAEAESDLDASLDEVIAELDAPLDAQWIAEILRVRMGAEVGLATSAAVLDRLASVRSAPPSRALGGVPFDRQSRRDRTDRRSTCPDAGARRRSRVSADDNAVATRQATRPAPRRRPPSPRG